MEEYSIILAVSSSLIGLCRVLSLGKLIRLWQHKKLHPNASLKDIESFEKMTKTNYIFRVNQKREIENF